MIEPHVLVSLDDQGIAQDFGTDRAQNRDREEKYLGKLVGSSTGLGDQRPAGGAQSK